MLWGLDYDTSAVGLDWPCCAALCLVLLRPCVVCLQEVPGEALLPGDIASIGRPKGGAGSDDKVVPAGKDKQSEGGSGFIPYRVCLIVNK